MCEVAIKRRGTFSSENGAVIVSEVTEEQGGTGKKVDGTRVFQGLPIANGGASYPFRT